MGKIIEIDNLESWREHLGDKRLGLVGGCFDVLHLGHIRFLESAQERIDVLMIALESDKKIETAKKRNPVHAQADRARILAHLDVVDYVLMLPYMDTDKQYFELVDRVRPHMIIASDGDNKAKQKNSQAQGLGATFIELPLVEGYSSSKIIHGTFTRN